MGWPLSSLPFVDREDGNRLLRSLTRIFEAPGEHDHTRTFMLHLLAQSSRVLLEMVATHVFVTESESVIVLTGQRVDAELAGLMTCDTKTVALSESNHGAAKESENDCLLRIRSVSQAGSVIDDGDDDYMLPPVDHPVFDDDGPSEPSRESSRESVVSELSMPTLSASPTSKARSVASVEMSAVISDVTLPRALRPVEEMLRAAENAVRAAAAPPHRIARELPRLGGSVASSSTGEPAGSAQQAC